MAQELLEAFAKAGGRDHLCDSCRPQVEGTAVRVGLLDTKIERTTPRFARRGTLAEMTHASSSCWLCAFLQLLVSRRFQAYHELSNEDCKHIVVAVHNQDIHTFESGRTSRDVYKDKRVLVRLCVPINAESVARKGAILARFQHSLEDPPHLSQLLDGAEGIDWANHPPFTSRIRPPRADFRLLRRWMHHCRANHGAACGKPSNLQVPRIRLIDVVGRRVVEHTNPKVPWVALSYCWGAPQQNALRKCNLAHYGQPGSLSRTELPPVLVDAMETTAGLGESYLWVDAMCIVQDDKHDKSLYLPMMETIYSLATVTIIDAANESCLNPGGLPGIRSSRRLHEPVQLGGICLTESLDPIGEPSSGYLEACTWATRGWTFQEGLLAPRYLIFTPDQIYWQCEKSSWCEGSFWEREDDLQIYRHFLADNLLSSMSTSPTDVEWITVYLSVIKNYLARKLSFEGDRLHAVSGVLNALARANGQSFFWAMPQSRLERSLAFVTHASAVPFTANHLHITSDGEVLESPMPSWSWLGWRSGLEFTSAESIVTNGHLGLHFYGVDAAGRPFRVDTPQPPAVPLDGIQQQIRYPVDVIHPWLDTTRQAVLQSDLAPSILTRKNLLPSLLCFWSSTAVLKIEARPGQGTKLRFPVDLTDGSTTTTVMWTRRADISLPLRGKLVVVGTDRMRMSHGGYLTLKLMLVDRSGEADVYRRRHLIPEVLEREWEKFQQRHWELIILV